MKTPTICMTVLGELKYDQRVFREAITLSKNNYQVTIIACTINPKKIPEKWDQINIEYLHLRSVRGKQKYLEFTLKLCRKLLARNDDILHAHDLDTLLPCILTAKLKRKMVIYDSHELFLHQTSLVKRSLERKVWSILEKLLIKHVDAVITVNDSIGRILTEWYQIPPPTILRNVPFFQPPPPSQKLRDILHLPPSKKIVLYQGEFMEGRGLRTLLNSILMLSDDYVLVLLGKGGLREEFDQMAKQYPQKIYVLDAVPFDELLNYTTSADVGMMLFENSGLNYYYALPNKFFEYMMAGVPVVASHFPEIEQIISQHPFGLLVDPNDSHAITNAILKICSNNTIFKNIARQARQYYHWKVEQKKLLAIYRQLYYNTTSSQNRQQFPF